jgi:hypothetical protein
MYKNLHIAGSRRFQQPSLYAHQAPTPEPIEDPLPGEHPIPQKDPVPSPNPEVLDQHKTQSLTTPAVH